MKQADITSGHCIIYENIFQICEKKRFVMINVQKCPEYYFPRFVEANTFLCKKFFILRSCLKSTLWELYGQGNIHPPEYKEYTGCSGKIVFFTIHCSPSLAYIVVRVLQSSQRKASVYSHSYWLAIFCTTNSSRVLARERWQTFENSWN